MAVDAAIVIVVVSVRVPTSAEGVVAVARLEAVVITPTVTVEIGARGPLASTVETGPKQLTHRPVVVPADVADTALSLGSVEEAGVGIVLLVLLAILGW